YPERIDGDVHFCGFSSASSYGASSYLILRPEGNVLIDSPRFAGPLVKRLEALGGVRTMVLTHRDDVADHSKFREHFGCERVMHEEDAEFPAERLIRGLEPVDLGGGLLVIPTPGHTPGHQVVLYREKYLFTGDHLAWDPEDGRLDALEDYCWDSWEEQGRSMERLLRWPFEWVLPGHGARHHAPAGEMRGLLEELISRM
ncbi:MAG TPA: MBL fold metallo-hydrolase, partial [Planctomycetota bacterium]|nr:MBL fold metallo-hydrolase [Planctomycetota bacterium]